MAKPSRSTTIIAFGDVHIPQHHRAAVEVLCRTAELVRPDLIVCLGDLLDCGQFSVHPPTWGDRPTSYDADVATANQILSRLERTCRKLVMLEGNHEYRIRRWAARATEGAGAFALLDPRELLAADGKRQYVPYGSANGRYPHYRVNKRIVAVHGWSYARHATKAHLTMSQGRSVIHGHTHRADASIVQNIWSRGRIIEARSAGCLCRLVPLYGTGRPVEWVHAFVLGYLGRRSDTLYTVPIMDDRCILPDGTEVRA